MAPITTIAQFIFSISIESTGRYIGKLTSVSRTPHQYTLDKNLQKHNNNKARPPHRHDINRVPKPPKVEIRPHRQNLSSTNQKYHDRDGIPKLETNPTAADNGLESITATEDNKAEY